MRLVLLGGDKARMAQRAKRDSQGRGASILAAPGEVGRTAAPGWQCFPAGTAGAPSTVATCWLQQQRALQPCQAVGTHPASLGTAKMDLLSWTAACLVCSLSWLCCCAQPHQRDMHPGKNVFQLFLTASSLVFQHVSYKYFIELGVFFIIVGYKSNYLMELHMQL